MKMNKHYKIQPLRKKRNKNSTSKRKWKRKHYSTSKSISPQRPNYEIWHLKNIFIYTLCCILLYKMWQHKTVDMQTPHWHCKTVHRRTPTAIKTQTKPNVLTCLQIKSPNQRSLGFIVVNKVETRWRKTKKLLFISCLVSSKKME